MKKFFLFTAALIGAACLNSCKKELEETPVSGQEQTAPGTIELTINAPAPGTKTSVSIDGSNYVPAWGEGDKLGVFVNGFSAGATAVNAELTNSVAGETASFTGTVTADPGDYTVYAFYPARAFYATQEGKKVDLEIPYIQFPDINTFDPKADLLAGVPKTVALSGSSVTVDDMQFRRIGAVLRIDLADNLGLTGESIKSLKLESAGSDILSGVVRYDFENQKFTVADGLGKNHVTADFTEDPLEFGRSIYMVVNPVTLTSGLNVTVLTTNHEITKTITAASGMELSSGKVTKIKITLDSTCQSTFVYFQDNFDWIYKYWDVLKGDVVYGNAYTLNSYNLDPVATRSTSTSAAKPYQQPNIWNVSSNTDSVGDAFTGLYYSDINKEEKVMYAQENYLKFGRTGYHSGIQLPAIDFGARKNVTLSFDWSVQDANQEFVIEVTGGGTCSDSGKSVSDSFTQTKTLYWETKSLVLSGLTSASRIIIRPNLVNLSPNDGSKMRWFIDNIKVTEAAPSPAEFPVIWNFPAPSSSWVAASDYSLVDKSFSGSYVYSDDHQGKIIVTSTANGSGGNDPTYRLPNETETWCPEGEYFILHYCMGLGSYWEFDIPNVKNNAGTYTISYKMAASTAGPKHFRLEYTFDDNWDSPVSIEANLSVPDNTDSSTMVNCTYSLDGNNVVEDVNASFHAEAMDAFKTLKIRAVVVSKQRCGGAKDLANNSGGTNRMLGNPTISFTAD